MQYVIVGLDGTDENALDRRLAVRADHIALGEKMTADGNMLYGAALLHDDGTMKGSMLVLDFDSDDELNNWLDDEPYVLGKVWEKIDIHKSNIRDPWQFNRTKEWFEEKANKQIS